MRDVERAESLMEHSPEEALALVSEVDASTIRGEQDRAYYALVYCEALYYNYVECEDEALARPMAERNDINVSVDVEPIGNKTRMSGNDRLF